MEENLTREDWQLVRKQHAAMLANALINIEAHRHMLKVCDDELKKFPEEDPKPEGVDEILK